MVWRFLAARRSIVKMMEELRRNAGVKWMRGN
jgi:hypothetical protein